jgi:hypothetical protein
MRKVLSLLVMAGIVWGLAGPAPASPLARVATGGPPLASAIVPIRSGTASVQITGRLEQRITGVEVLADGHDGQRIVPAVITWWVVVEGQGAYELAFDANNHQLDVAGKFVNKVVVLSGNLVDGRVRVTGVRAAEPPARPGVRVHILSVLRYYELERFPPIRVWEVQAGGRTYRLRLNTDQLVRQATALIDQAVLVDGTLRGDQVTVTGLGGGLPVTRLDA